MRVPDPRPVMTQAATPMLKIKDVAERTGVAAATIRMWEQRYGFPAPQRTASGYRQYSERDVEAIRTVVAHAVKVGADSDRYPHTWLFEHRWGGSRGSQQINGHPIRRDEVGGRTTAWVPAVQK